MSDLSKPFLQALREDPLDVSLYGIFADWCEENNHPDADRWRRVYNMLPKAIEDAKRIALLACGARPTWHTQTMVEYASTTVQGDLVRTFKRDLPWYLAVGIARRVAQEAVRMYYENERWPTREVM